MTMPVPEELQDPTRASASGEGGEPSMIALSTAQPSRHPAPTAKATRLAHLIFERPELDRAEQFLVDFGLRAVAPRHGHLRYLRGTGRPTEVQVLDVLASSAAERAGLQPGDQVLSYAGTRVFDMRELNALSREGNPGETVVMEVRRNGRTEQLVVPRGVLGMSGGAMRGSRSGGPRGGR